VRTWSPEIRRKLIPAAGDQRGVTLPHGYLSITPQFMEPNPVDLKFSSFLEYECHLETSAQKVPAESFSVGSTFPLELPGGPFKLGGVREIGCLKLSVVGYSEG
jgi:hypothetical protein